MRIKGGGQVKVETPRREKAKARPATTPPSGNWYRDAFEVAPVRAVPRRAGATTVVKDLAETGRARLAEDARERDRAALVEVGRVVGGLGAELVIEVINHFAQRARPARERGMVLLGELVGALFVEFWARDRGPDAVHKVLEAVEDVDAVIKKELGVGAGQAIERFIDFIEETEGQPAKRLAGTVYADERG